MVITIIAEGSAPNLSPLSLIRILGGLKREIVMTMVGVS
jgi:hypothetical protein